jgi:hypothetical protein
MDKQKPLYEDPDIKIEHHPRSHEDHLLFLMSGGEELNYIIQRGILEEIATTPRHRVKEKMRRVNELMVEDAYSRGLSVDSLGFAMAQAYIEQERRLNVLVDQMRRESEQ